MTQSREGLVIVRPMAQAARRGRRGSQGWRGGGVAQKEWGGGAAWKRYWENPAVRNFRGVWGNGATEHAKRARSWKRRIQPSVRLRVTAPQVYSTKPHARVERGIWKRAGIIASTAPEFYQ